MAWQEGLALLEGAYSQKTIRGYASDFRVFESWCREAGRTALPATPETVAAYVNAVTDSHKPATTRRRISAIARLHRVVGAADPTLSEIVRLALRRMHRRHGQRQRQPLGLRAEIRDRLIAACGTDLKGLRDAALIRTGYDTLCRRAEIVALMAEDASSNEDGTGSILVRRSKADPLGVGRMAFLAPPTIRAIEAWLGAAGVTKGPLFRRVRGGRPGAEALAPYSVTRLVKEIGTRAGYGPEVVDNLSGHSFRIGAALDMVEHGVDMLPIMQAGGWSSPTMVLRYTSQVDVAKSGAAQLYRLRSSGGAGFTASGPVAG